MIVLQNKIITIFGLKSDFFTIERNQLFFNSVFSEMYQKLRGYCFEDYLSIPELCNFGCNLFGLVRGVKNKISFDSMKEFLQTVPDTPGKALKLKEAVLIIVNNLN
jgi:uncharacterized protein YutD